MNNLCTCAEAKALAANLGFEQEMHQFLRTWVQQEEDKTLLRFERPLLEYLAEDALRDFFLNTPHPLQQLIKVPQIAAHLGRGINEVYFDVESGDPLLSPTERRIYNLARRMDSELMHVPFRFIQPNKQTETGDDADITTYPVDSEELRYNSGNHFTSRSANNIVFDELSKRCKAKTAEQLTIFFEYGFLEDRLQDVKAITAAMHNAGETQLQYFVIYSRHSPQEGHFGVSLVVMDPAQPDFPVRVLVCDTLLKQLPHHPRWWHHFVAEYSNVFGDAIAEIIEDLSHPLQKVNIKGDNPYRHDWDCPYYAASMAGALADLVKANSAFLLNGQLAEIHLAMKSLMPDYYHANLELKTRAEIQQVNRLKRWQSGSNMINSLADEVNAQKRMSA